MQSLNDLLLALSNLDDAAAPVEFDPLKLAGDVAQKVDAIETVLSRLDGEEERLKAYANQFQASAKAVANNAQRLRDYVKWSMEQSGFSKLPGERFRLQLMPSLSVDVGPVGPDQAMKYPALVKRDLSYSWDKKAVKEALQSGERIEYAKLVTRNNIQFFVRKG